MGKAKQVQIVGTEKSLSAIVESADRIEEILLSDIALDPDQPRKYFDPEKLRELADTIREEGLAQAILVEPNPNSPIPKFQLIAGERRYHAAALLGHSRILARIKAGMSREKAVVLQAVENVQREPLKLDEMCTMCAKLVELLGLDAAAKKLGKSKAWVSRRAAVDTMDVSIFYAIRDGLITDIDAAHELKKLHELSAEYAADIIQAAEDKGQLITRAWMSECIEEVERDLARKASQPGLDLGDGEKEEPPPKPNSDNSYRALLDGIERNARDLNDEIEQPGPPKQAKAPAPNPNPGQVARKELKPDPKSPAEIESFKAEDERRARMIETAQRLERRYITSKGSDPDDEYLPETHLADIIAEPDCDGQGDWYNFNAYLTEQQIDAVCDLVSGRAQLDGVRDLIDGRTLVTATAAMSKFGALSEKGAVASVIDFADACLVATPGHMLAGSDVLARYEKFCAKKKITAAPAIVTSAVLADLGFERTRTEKAKLYANVAFKK